MITHSQLGAPTVGVSPGEVGRRTRRRRGAPPTARLKTLLVFGLAALYPFHSIMVGLNVSRGDLLVAVVLVPILVGVLIGRIQVPRYVLHGLAFLGVALLSFLANVHQEGAYFSSYGSVTEMVKFVAAMAWMVAIFWLLKDDISNRLLLFATVSVLLGSVFAGWSIFENIVLRVGRPTGPFENPNVYGNYLVLIAVLLGVATSLIRDQNLSAGTGVRSRWYRVFVSARLALFPILILGILTTGSRGAMLGGLTALFVSTRLRMPRRVSIARLGMGLVGVLVLVGSVTWFLRQDPHVLRRVQGASRGEGPNVDARKILWSVAIETFAAHPVLGVGYGEYPYYTSTRLAELGLDPPHVTHQTYLSTAAETGLVGLLVLLWLFGAVLRDTRVAHPGPHSRVLLLGRAFVLATCVQGLVMNVEQVRSLWIMFGVIAALSLQSRMQGNAGPVLATTDARAVGGSAGADRPQLVGPARRTRGRRR